MDKQTENELFNRLLKGAEYFYKLKPSDFSKNYYREWNRLMVFCKLIEKYNNVRLENLAKEILMRPPVEQQSLIESLDKTDNKKTNENSTPQQLPGQQELPLLKE